MLHIWRGQDGAWYAGRMSRETYRGRGFRDLFERRRHGDCLHRRGTFGEIARVAATCHAAARGAVLANGEGPHLGRSR